MAVDADEATTALIASMLAEENAYHYSAYDKYEIDDSADEDYGQGAKRRKPGRKGTTGTHLQDSSGYRLSL